MRSWQVLNLWGIPFKIHSNWFILSFLFSWLVSAEVNFTSGEVYTLRESWLIGFTTVFLLLGLIIFNQIIHTYFCIREGMKIKKICDVKLQDIEMQIKKIKIENNKIVKENL